MGKSVDAGTGSTVEEYAARLEPYTFEYTSKLSGVPVEDLRELAAVFAEPDTRVMSCLLYTSTASLPAPPGRGA